MNTKTQILNNLRAERQRWEDLLASLSEAQITVRNLPSDLSIKDVVGHLHFWQQISIARLEAGLHNREPIFPNWLEVRDPDADENLETINASIHAAIHDRPWPVVYHEWQDGFARVLELGEAVPEADLLEKGRFAWMEGYALADVLKGTYGHHHEEHYKPLDDLLRAQGKIK